MVHTMSGLGSLTATDGVYELSAVTGGEVRDHTGNALGDGATVTFTVDQTPPQTAITLGPAIADGDNGWYVSPVDVAVAVDDDTATVRCVLDPAEAPTGFADLPSGPCEIGTIDSDGGHIVYAASIDEAGNDGPVSDATFRVDRTAPTASIVLDPVTPDGPRGWYVDPVKITIGVDDDTATVRCVSNPATVPTSFADLPDRPCHPLRVTRHGHYVVYAAAIDRAGNTGPLVHTRFKSVGSRRCQGLVPTHVGTLGDDMIHGTPGSDVIVALGGDDVIRGRGGNDVVCGGPGNDRIHGGAGSDRLDGGRGRDQLDGQAENDIVAGGPGNDQLDGGDGRDWLDAQSGNDLIFAGDGDDTVHGRRGHDLVFGGRGNDRLYGGPGNDALFGGPGNDRLHGNAGNDRLVGGRGVDQLRGGPGRNRTATTIAPR
jgi:Ca2+-binding RTX toxin-like protein